MGVYKERMKIFEQSFEESTNRAAIESNIENVKQKIASQFVNYKETKSRIQRLNESEIMQLKHVMTELTMQVHAIAKKQAEQDADKLKVNNNRLPRDIQFLSKDEVTLRRELALSLEDTEDMKESLNKDLKRLRREHYKNMSDMEQIITKLDLTANQLKNVVDRQGLND